MTEQEKIEKLAIEIMGWHKEFNLKVESYYNWVNNKGEFKVTMLWNPYTSWNDAGMIVERLKKQGYKFALIMPGKPPIEFFAQAAFSKTIISGANYIAGSTPQEAICEAALKTLEEVKDDRNSN